MAAASAALPQNPVGEKSQHLVLEIFKRRGTQGTPGSVIGPLSGLGALRLSVRPVGHSGSTKLDRNRVFEVPGSR